MVHFWLSSGPDTSMKDSMRDFEFIMIVHIYLFFPTVLLIVYTQIFLINLLCILLCVGPSFLITLLSLLTLIFFLCSVHILLLSINLLSRVPCFCYFVLTFFFFFTHYILSPVVPSFSPFSPLFYPSLVSRVLLSVRPNPLSCSCPRGEAEEQGSRRRGRVD